MAPHGKAHNVKPWIEKYRPGTLDEIGAQDHAVNVLKKSLSLNNLPHMLFYGPPGTGKTSTILALAKDLFGPELMPSRVLELNASDERGIDVVRTKIKNFARITVSQAVRGYPCPPFKLIILDEADSMTQDAQSALRRTMETYSRITRFCLICNYITRIIEPLTSRCTKFRFKALDYESTYSRLEYIAGQEKLTYEPEVLKVLVDVSSGDLRKAITYLQSSARLGKLSVSEIEEAAGIVPSRLVEQLWNEIMKRDGELDSCVDDIVAQGYSAAQVVIQLHDFVIRSEDIPSRSKLALVQEIAAMDKMLIDGAGKHKGIYCALANV